MFKSQRYVNRRKSIILNDFRASLIEGEVVIAECGIGIFGIGIMVYISFFV